MNASTPTTPQSSGNSEPDEQRASPKNYAPHLTDDPEQDVGPTTPEEIKAFSQKVGELMRKKGQL